MDEFAQAKTLRNRERKREDLMQTGAIGLGVAATVKMLQQFFPDLPWPQINEWILFAVVPLIAWLSSQWTGRRHRRKSSGIP